MNIDVAVIGAGISGLVAAYELSRRGHSVAILERQVRAGGSARSEPFGGFLMEHGPSSVSAASAGVITIARTLGLDPHRCDLGEGVRRRFLVGGGTLHPLALHPLGLLTSNYLSLRARLRVIGEVAVPSKSQESEESVADFFTRRFGSELSTRVIDPLVGGMFAGTAESMSMQSVFPALTDMERRHGSITCAVMWRRLRGGRMPGRRLFSWRNGIATLPQALVDHLQPMLVTGVVVRRLRRIGDRFRIDIGRSGMLEARTVVIATQAAVMAQLLESLDDEGAEAAAGIAAPPLAVVFLGYRREQIEHPLDGLGYLTPKQEGRELSGALFASTMFAGRAPPGHVALAGYIGGARAPHLAGRPAAELIASTRAEFRDLVGARGKPVVARVRHWEVGLPQYNLGHSARLAALRNSEARHPGLVLTGNYFSGPSVGACVEEATAAAGRIHRFLVAARDRCAREARAVARHGE